MNLSEILTKHAIILLTLVFALATLLIVWRIEHLSEHQIQSASLKNAKIYSDTLTEFRSLYTSEVIDIAKRNGLQIAHNYTAKGDAIPLPTTLIMMLSKNLYSQSGGINSHLYSPYPFPSRKVTGGLNDRFSRDAWQALQKQPNQPFYRFEEVNGQTALRYASADLMKEKCVICHNTHPDTPKTGWKIGDLRGVLEVRIPIESSVNLANQMVRETLFTLFSILALSLIGIGLVIRQLRLSTQHAEDTQRQLKKISLTDSLTGIGNRRKFDQAISKEWRIARRTKLSLAVVLVDVDDFKPYNDNYGHQQGDIALQEIAKVMASCLHRASDLLCRYGGEEFILLLPNTDKEGAAKFTENLRRQIENNAIKHAFSRAANVITVSAGVAATVPEDGAKPQSLTQAADEALYLAKASGRNCVRQASSNPTSNTPQPPSNAAEKSLNLDIS